MKKTVVILIFIALFSKFIGFIRDIVLAYFFGASNISDAYLLAQTIPVVLFGIISQGILTGYIPMFTKIEDNYGIKESIKYSNNLLHFLFLVCTVICIVCLVFTGTIVKIFGSGLDKETFNIAVIFTRLSIFSIYFSGAISVFNGFLHMHKSFIIPSLLGFPMSIVTVLSIVFGYYYDLRYLALGILIGTFIQFIVVFTFSLRKGYKYKLFLNLQDKHLRKMIILSIPIIMGTSVNQINKLIDVTLASRISVGGISALNYANTLNGFILGTIVTSVTTVIYPLLSRLASKNELTGFKSTLFQAMNALIIIMVPATVGATVLATPIVTILFGRGAFDEDAISMTSIAFFYYSIGLIGYTLRDVLANAFYSLQDTKTPMINAGIAMLINIVLNIILSKFLGIGGLALATSISAIISSMLLFISLKNKIGINHLSILFETVTKIMISAIIMGIIVKFFYNGVSFYINSLLSLIISVVVGIFIYFFLILVMKVKDLDFLITTIKVKLKKV